MKNKHVSFIFLNLVVCVCILPQYGVISYIGVLMIVGIHELGHYMCAAIEDRNPEFCISSSVDPAVRYDGERTIFIAAGGMIANLLFFPLYIKMEIMDMEPWYLLLLIIGGSLRDIMNIVKVLRKSK